MPYEYEDLTLELETGDEFEMGYEELEADSGELEAPFEFEAGARIVRAAPEGPRWGDDSAFRSEFGEFEEELDQEVFPPDTRVVVKNTTLIPFRFICHIAIGYLSTDGKVKASDAASGTLIGRRHVLTCGHAFDDATLQGKQFKVATVTVTPGRNSADPKKSQWKPFGSVTVKASAVKVHPNWPKNADRQFDYALITLDTDIGAKRFKVIGNAPLGCWGITGGTSLTPLAPKNLEKKIVNIGGYPGDKCGADPLSPASACDREKQARAQFIAYDEVIDPAPGREPGMIYHKADLKKGQSGAPLWRWEKSTGMRSLVGIQSYEAHAVAADGTRTPAWNAAVRNTAALMTTLKSWGWKA